jgi:hypothetical protein
MRAEMLKRLDELMARVSRDLPIWESWQAIHAELVAERCDACRRSSLYSDFLPEDFLICQLRKVAVRPSFYCDDFAKKEPA